MPIKSPYQKTKHISCIATLLLVNLITSVGFADITVTGKGSIDVKPNIATFNLSIETKAVTAKDAASKNANQTSETIKILKALLPESDAVTTQHYTIYPETQYDNKTNIHKSIGFIVTNMINVKTNNITALGDLLDKVSNSGITTINNLTFSYNNPDEIYNRALTLAVANAKIKAEIIAKAGNMQIKEIKDISVLATNDYRPMPMYAMAEARAAVATPIEAPDVKTEANVEVVFKT
jgi:uncharacterized protein YggE